MSQVMHISKQNIWLFNVYKTWKYQKKNVFYPSIILCTWKNFRGLKKWVKKEFRFSQEARCVRFKVTTSDRMSSSMFSLYWNGLVCPLLLYLTIINTSTNHCNTEHNTISITIFLTTLLCLTLRWSGGVCIVLRACVSARRWESKHHPKPMIQ